MEDALALKGRLIVREVDLATGLALSEQVVDNLVVTVGKNLLRDFLRGIAVTGLSRFAIGTNSPPVAVAQGNTQLGSEVHRGAITSMTADVSKLTVDYYLPSGAANGSTLVEAGLFGNGATDVANSGTMYSRATFTGIVKNATKAVTFTWDLFFNS